MSDGRPSREQLLELARTDPEKLVDLALQLWDRQIVLEAKIKSLELNSRNSSKPPSSDKGNFTNPPKDKSKGKKSKRKSGGQPGHQGSTLAKSDSPDVVAEHRLAAGTRCPNCGAELPIGDPDHPLDDHHCVTRQVFDLPAIHLEITEHRAEQVSCPNCGTVVNAGFPQDVNAPTQYGAGVRAAAVYLGGFQLLPYKRLAECFEQLFGCSLSEGALGNIVKRAGKCATQALEPIRAALLEAPVAHADETSCTVNGKRH